MTMRLHFELAAAICCLALTAGCGVAAGASPKSPNGAYRGAQASPEKTVVMGGIQADRDSDGIPDDNDRELAKTEEADQKVASLAPVEAPPPPPPPPGQAPKPPAGSAGQKEDGQAQSAQREGAYLIYTANLTMAVYQVDGALLQVEQIGKEMGGYLATRQDRSVTIRVPRARFEEAIKKIEGTGDVIHRDIQAQDVSDEFVDTEVRLKNARAMRDRLEDLLKKAPVKEALEIEKELGRVTQEIERMEGRLKLLKDKIAFSTITVSFDARAASLHTMPIRLPFGWLQTLGLPNLLRLNETK